MIRRAMRAVNDGKDWSWSDYAVAAAAIAFVVTVFVAMPRDSTPSNGPKPWMFEGPLGYFTYKAPPPVQHGPVGQVW